MVSKKEAYEEIMKKRIKTKQSTIMMMVGMLAVALMVTAVILINAKTQDELKRIWECVDDPAANNCTVEEIASSKKWVTGLKPSEIVIQLKGAEITVSEDDINAVQEKLRQDHEQIDKENEKVHQSEKQLDVLQKSLG